MNKNSDNEPSRIGENNTRERAGHFAQRSRFETYSVRNTINLKLGLSHDDRKEHARQMVLPCDLIAEVGVFRSLIA